jgi:hypothetical protein
MTRNKSGGDYNCDNHGFPNIIDIEKKKVLERAQNLFHHTISQFVTLRTILGRGDLEITRSQNVHFHFNHKEKTINSYLLYPSHWYLYQ